MRHHLWLAVSCAAASQLACGFILDFDSLTGAPQPLADGGLDASAGCACDDQDPCTVDSCADGGCKFTPMVCVASDSCHVSVCNAGQCEESVPGGFVDDGYERTLEGDLIFRTTTTAAGSRFYVATYGNFDDKRDIVLNVFEAIASDDAGTSTREFVETRIAKIFPGDSIVSPAALVVDKRYLNVYFATRPTASPKEGAGQLRRVRFSVGADINAAQPALAQVDVGVMSLAPNFRVTSDTLGPAAGLLAGGTPFVVWPGCATNGEPKFPECTVTSSPLHGIYAVSGDPDFQVSPSLFQETGAATGLTALGNGTTPGASWIAGTDSGTTAVRSAFLDDTGQPVQPQEFAQCQTLLSTTHHPLASTATTDGSLRVLGWSEQRQAESSAQIRTLSCDAGSCTDGTSACDAPDNNLDGVSNLDIALLQRSQSATEWFRSTALVTGDDKATSLSLVLSQVPGTAAELADAGVDAGVDLDAATGSDAATSLNGWSSQANVLSANAKSVDWPSIAANGDRVVVAWTDNKKTRHLVRQRVCFPE